MRPASSNGVQSRITLPQAQIWLLHLLEHLLHLVQLQLAAIVLLERVQLARRDLKLL
jgi:hypothetical protein